MSTETVKIIDSSRKVVATAQVAEREEGFAGLIDLSPMPASLREKFDEYEEIGSGTHERTVVDRARFDAKLALKKKAKP